MSDSIPNRLHFIWLGSELPCFATLAAKSALLRNPGARVLLWHEPNLRDDARARLLRNAGVEFRELSFSDLLASAARQPVEPSVVPDFQSLARIWDRLSAPAARSNLLRLLILFSEGGIYLDTDTLTLKDLSPFRRESRAFYGVEHILWSRERLRRSHPYFWTLGPLLSGLRLVNARLPNGYKLHRWQLSCYGKAANNAVLGFSPGHPFIARAFERIGQLEEGDWTKRYRLGTHLLQELVAADDLPGDLPKRYPPDFFYPLGPVISRHYFQKRSDAAAAARSLVPPDAHVLHWYASVADLGKLDEQYLRRHPDESVFSHLCTPLLE